MKNKAEEKVSCNEEAVQAVDPRVAGPIKEETMPEQNKQTTGTHDKEVVLVYTADGPVVTDVTSLSDLDLYDSLTDNQSFIHSTIVMINEICLTSEPDERMFTPFAVLLSECEHHLDYIRAASDELRRRLAKRGKEKTA